MKIAVVGSGISGLSAAWLLSKNHHVDLYEKDDRLGGHANTQHVKVGADQVSVDTGFIVYNEKTYPNLTALYNIWVFEQMKPRCPLLFHWIEEHANIPAPA